MAVGVVVAAFAIGILGTRDGSDAGPSDPAPGSTSTRAPEPAGPGVTVALPAHATGRRIPAGFLGLSFEFQAVRAYTGPNPGAINPVLEQLIRNLSPGQAPVLRIGGDSTDVSYAPGAEVHPPPYVAYPLTPSWMATTAALAHELRARMIMGLNLAANDPALAAAEARDYVRAMGRGTIEALEIGNEPNIYGQVTVYHTVFGVPLHARGRDFGYPAFRDQFAAIARASPKLALAGPALAVGPTPTNGSWVQTMPDFLRRDPRVTTMTVHRYPLRNCYVAPKSAQYPTVAHLLSPYATSGLVSSLRRWIGIAHAQRRALRVDELNSVACRGKKGISDTFASSLWSVDALFSLANAGVDGVNLHTLPKSAYELFQFSRSHGRWRSWVRPVYYGLQLFAQATPPGSRLLALPRLGHRSLLSVWATRAADGSTRVVLIDKDPNRGATVTLRPPRGASARATLERLTAPGVDSRNGITLGGRTYGRETYSGRLAAPRAASLAPAASGGYRLTVPRGSAALVTFAPAR
ncbi:MAG: glycosyl hydrolase family 79 C-terminal domain-containing protein [Solirubrobacteraceae bacterium]